MNRDRQPAIREKLPAEFPAELRDSKMIDAVLTVAFEAHKCQVREDRYQRRADPPYIVHPAGVAKLVVKHWVVVELSDTLETVVAAAFPPMSG